MAKNPKSALTSSTILLTLLFTLQTMGPQLEKIGEAKKIETKDWVVLFNILVNAIAIIVVRFSDTESLYTPKGIPGPDKEDLLRGTRKLIDKP